MDQLSKPKKIEIFCLQIDMNSIPTIWDKMYLAVYSNWSNMDQSWIRCHMKFKKEKLDKF